MNFCSVLVTSSKRQDTTKPTQKQINAVSTSICYLRDGRVPIKGGIVKLLTESNK